MIHPRKITLKFVAGEQAEGVGVTVRRSIGSSQLRNLDPFLMLDEAHLALPAGFPAHPHRGFETVSYILPTSKGRALHQDFLGNKGELRPGDLQWMTAGRGIVHHEMPASTDDSHGLQLWVNLPKARKMTEPRYQEVSRDSVPHSFDKENGVEALVFAGEAFGVKGPINTGAPVTYIHFILQKNGKLSHEIPEGHNAFVYVLSGSGHVAGETAAPHETCVLEVQGDGVEISTDDGLECLVISGKPLNEPIVQYGPFVMNTKAEIRQTMADYQEAKNGFENARKWTPSIGH